MRQIIRLSKSSSICNLNYGLLARSCWLDLQQLKSTRMTRFPSCFCRKFWSRGATSLLLSTVWFSRVDWLIILCITQSYLNWLSGFQYGPAKLNMMVISVIILPKASSSIRCQYLLTYLAVCFPGVMGGFFCSGLAQNPNWWSHSRTSLHSP
jgi:hypothetical protein